MSQRIFLQSTILPILKPKSGTAVSSDNYRGIALSSIFGKVFDNIVLHRYHEMLCKSDLQFGLKKKSSTNLCTMVLKETISYYIHSDSSAFCTFLMPVKLLIGSDTASYFEFCLFGTFLLVLCEF